MGDCPSCQLWNSILTIGRLSLGDCFTGSFYESHPFCPQRPGHKASRLEGPRFKEMREPTWGSPGRPVGKTLHFCCKGVSSIPGQGTKVLQAHRVQPNEKLNSSDGLVGRRK